MFILVANEINKNHHLLLMTIKITAWATCDVCTTNPKHLDAMGAGNYAPPCSSYSDVLSRAEDVSVDSRVNNMIMTFFIQRLQTL